ncbi:hypothetical protein EOD41_00075 [Mucilaginibacter limnophilus]|uniref:Uncharacterized protein n=1 Tax=Mucilaginibacter limnophilus TaxID=1932778 RepID=A0A3S2X080_9SPHI|nr:hypothetical protein [Mucilaginibacter limnophilus]RVU02373.1 hypothetical protein EOD41_00075 [Mucilaginibacter limnophilus]
MLNKLTVKKIVEFNRLSEKRRSTFINQLKTPPKPKIDESGGDYWVTGLSALGTAFKQNDNNIIKERIEPLAGKYKAANNNRNRNQFKRNLDILINYQDFDFSTLRPSTDLKFPTKSKEPLNINNTSLHVLPQHVFTYKVNDEPTVGAIWFVAWIDKFALSDLGIYSESLFKHLNQVYSNRYKVDPTYCLTVDALSMSKVSYDSVLSGKISSLLEPSIDTLSRYL